MDPDYWRKKSKDLQPHFTVRVAVPFEIDQIQIRVFHPKKIRAQSLTRSRSTTKGMTRQKSIYAAVYAQNVAWIYNEYNWQVASQVRNENVQQGARVLKDTIVAQSAIKINLNSPSRKMWTVTFFSRLVCAVI